MAESAPAVAWSQRVRRVGGYMQLEFAAFWLIRGANSVGGATGRVLLGSGVVLAAAALVFSARASAGTGRRPTGAEAKRIERSVMVATVVELVASVILPVIVIADGHRDWVLPSIAITIGPLLLWLDHLVDIPRYRPVGWLLTAGPLLLVALMSGPALAAATGLGAGGVLLVTATAGFHDLASLRPARPTGPARLAPGHPGRIS
jgi:protein-S-isoprenylcysteine O-methyltransferase Ste14